MIELKSRDTWIEIDLEKFEKNMEYIIERADGKILWPAVKSNAYQHGIDGLFDTFIKKGIHHFCVAYIDEAIHLQKLADKNGEKISILIFGDVPIDYLDKMRKNWYLTIATDEYAELIMQSKNIEKFKVHIKVDSGMNRRGFKTKEDFQKVVSDLIESDSVEIKGLYSHFATADNEPNEFFKKEQLQKFNEITKEYRDMFTYIHFQNSHGLMTLKNDEVVDYNGARPGAICYGLSVDNARIKPIASLYTRIMDVKEISKGEFVGYNITFEAPADGYIAVLPIGYADGIWRSNTGNTVYIDSVPVPIVGRICMEQCMIYTTDAELLKCGKRVTFFNEKFPIQLMAKYNETIDYEIMCSLSSRIPRKYVKGSES